MWHASAGNAEYVNTDLKEDMWRQAMHLLLLIVLTFYSRKLPTLLLFLEEMNFNMNKRGKIL